MAELAMKIKNILIVMVALTLVVSLGPNARAKMLVLDAGVEVDAGDAAAFDKLRPRMRDMFNTYLRAIDPADLEAPGATLNLRAQLLRRIRVVSAPAEPRDLLFTSFILK